MKTDTEVKLFYKERKRGNSQEVAAARAGMSARTARKEDASNVVLVGPNGVGKTMLAQNLAYQALLGGHTALFVTASAMLNELAAQEGSYAFNRVLKRYTQVRVLVIDEVGYLSYDSRHADLLFEVVTRRYQQRSTILTTNRPFSEWNEVFPNAACVVTLVDRLMHRAEIIHVEGRSFRLKEAQERTAERESRRKGQRKKGGDEA